MSLIANIVGFSLFGLAARFGQLGIQQKNLFHNMSGHFASMGAFGVLGYWAYQWDQRAAVLMAEKRAQITSRRQPALEREPSEEA